MTKIERVRKVIEDLNEHYNKLLSLNSAEYTQNLGPIWDQAILHKVSEGQKLTDYLMEVIDEMEKEDDVD